MVVVFRKEFISVAVAWALLWALAFAATANAGPLEDAEAAIGKGDYASALQLLITLVDQDNTQAERLLGIMYIKGLGVPQDYKMGMRWMRVAANKGLAEAENDVALLYQRGWGVDRNDAEAIKWYRRAADHGMVTSQVNLADAYVVGSVVQQNLDEALKWYRIAADQGSPYAENVVGLTYERGFHVAQDEAEAFRYFRRAANKIYDRPGNTWIHSPQYNFAAMYASGRGTAQDYVKALMWFTLAVSFGDTKPPAEFGVDLLGTSKLTAPEQRDKLMALMTSAQIAEAEKLAREWQPHPVVVIEPRIESETRDEPR
jgi:TPR repeat protein